MGIPSCRFLDKMHEEFLCTVCTDVAIDPVTVNDCEHIFCRECISSDQICRCPTCQQSLKAPKWNELKGAIKRCYLGLRVKCLNPSCNQTLDVTTFESHDMACTVTFQFCPDCNFKSRRCETTGHSCTKVLKEFYEAKLGLVNGEVNQLKEMFVAKLERIEQENKNLREVMNEIQLKDQFKREKFEDKLHQVKCQANGLQKQSKKKIFELEEKLKQVQQREQST